MAYTRSWPRFIVHFVNEHIEFRIPELEAVVKSFSTQIQFNNTDLQLSYPFLLVSLPSEACARKITSRAVLVRSVYRYWSNGSDHSTALDKVRELSSEFLEPFKRADTTLKCVIDGYNRKVPHEEKMAKITSFMDILNSEGNVKLTDPDHRIHILEYYAPDVQELKQVYIGHWIADGQRDLPKKYNLQERIFIGNTSMDPGLSMIMANMAMVRKHDLVLDPFVGTGSLLVSSAHFGAFVLGTDIDYMLLHARARPSRVGQKVRAKNESVRNNLHQYGMAGQFLDVMVADSSRLDMFKPNLFFDAIVTDPPYGIRESSIRVGGDGELLKTLTDEEKKQHIPGKEKYTLSYVFNDLLVFAAKFLKIGGRLVYWLPVNRERYSLESLPSHPCLTVIANSEQPITWRIGRRLITMEKCKEYMGQKSVENAAMQAQLDSFREDCFLPREKEEREKKKRKRMRKEARIAAENENDEQLTKNGDNVNADENAVEVTSASR